MIKKNLTILFFILFLLKIYAKAPALETLFNYEKAKTYAGEKHISKAKKLLWKNITREEHLPSVEQLAIILEKEKKELKAIKLYHFLFRKMGLKKLLFTKNENFGASRHFSSLFPSNCLKLTHFYLLLMLNKVKYCNIF